MWDMNRIVGSHDLLLLTLDTLRYDVATDLFAAGRTPHFAAWLPPEGWEARHTPGSFTYAAHQAFFAGFLPTPPTPGPHPRLFATRFPGSETSTASTFVVDAPDIVTGLADHGYHTVGIGGVGFFNPASPLGRVLPSLFAEFHWSRAMGVTAPDSTQRQFELAAERLDALSAAGDEPALLFINVSALHQPNRHYAPEPPPDDTVATHGDALAYVDSQLPILNAALRRRRRPWFVIATSDHGTTYGEDGYTGHRLAHPTVWTVPFAAFRIGAQEAA